MWPVRAAGAPATAMGRQESLAGLYRPPASVVGVPPQTTSSAPVQTAAWPVRAVGAPAVARGRQWAVVKVQEPGAASAPPRADLTPGASVAVSEAAPGKGSAGVKVAATPDTTTLPAMAAPPVRATVKPASRLAGSMASEKVTVTDVAVDSVRSAEGLRVSTEGAGGSGAELPPHPAPSSTATPSNVVLATFMVTSPPGSNTAMLPSSWGRPRAAHPERLLAGPLVHPWSTLPGEVDRSFAPGHLRGNRMGCGKMPDPGSGRRASRRYRPPPSRPSSSTSTVARRSITRTGQAW